MEKAAGWKRATGWLHQFSSYQLRFKRKKLIWGGCSALLKPEWTPSPTWGTEGGSEQAPFGSQLWMGDISDCPDCHLDFLGGSSGPSHGFPHTQLVSIGPGPGGGSWRSNCWSGEKSPKKIQPISQEPRCHLTKQKML